MKPPHLVLSIAGIAAICVVVLSLRLGSLDYLLPHFPEPDRYLAEQTEYLWKDGDPWAAPQRFYFYPSITARMISALPAPRTSIAPEDRDDLERQLRTASGPLLRVRMFIACISILAIPLTWLLARRFLGPGASFLAAALLATSFLFNLLAAQARLHAFQATLAVGLVVAALALARKPTWPRYLLAGVLAALAASSFQTGVFVAAPLFLAHLLRVKTSGDADASRWRILLPIALMGAAVLWSYPFLAEKPDGGEVESTSYTIEHDDGGAWVLRMGNQVIPLANFNLAGFGLIVQYLWWNDPTILLLLVPALLTGIPRLLFGRKRIPRERLRELWIVLAYFVPHYFALGSYKMTHGRFLVPLLPYMAVAAAWGAQRVLEVVRRPRADGRAFPRWHAVLPSAALLALPTFGMLALDALRREPDTVEQAAAWLRENADPGSDKILVSPTLDIPLFQSDEALGRNIDLLPKLDYVSGSHLRFVYYQDELPPELRGRPAFHARLMGRKNPAMTVFQNPERADAYIKASEADFAVVEVSGRTRAFPGHRRMRETIQKYARLEASFRPKADEDGPDTPGKDYQDTPYHLMEVIESQAMGQVIEIYRFVE